MIRASAARTLLVPALACCLSACTGWSRPLVRVDTANADVAAYAERFNLIQDRYRVITRFVDAPAESLARGGSDADALIGPGLASRDLVGKLRPLDELLRPGRLNGSAFFPGLLESGRTDGVLRALPLSFRVPVVVVRAGAEGLPSFAVTPDDLAALDTASLSWTAEMVYHAAVFFGADFRWLPDGGIGLQRSAVAQAVDQARRLIREEASGETPDTPDSVPPRARLTLQMLLDGRIDFLLTDLQRFLDAAPEQREMLSMRWLGTGEGVRAEDDVTYAVVRADSPNARGAQAFVMWLFEPATQSALLEFGRREQAMGFGIAGGFPALVRVARYDLVTRYPALLGRVPLPAELHAPAAPGADWGWLREAVVVPWFWAEVQGVDQPSLAESVASWRQRSAADEAKTDRARLVDTDKNGR